jgi:hypothetical protein
MKEKSKNVKKCQVCSKATPTLKKCSSCKKVHYCMPKRRLGRSQKNLPIKTCEFSDWTIILGG